MLEHWIKPLEKPFFGASSDKGEALGHLVRFQLEEIHPGRTLALIGADEKWANHVRRHLYSFRNGLNNSVLYDLGNFHSQKPDFILEAIKELLDSRVLPVVIGARRDVALPLIKYFESRDPENQALYLAESLPSWLNNLSDPPKTQFLGIQQHVSYEILEAIAIEHRLPVVRLGTSRDALEDMEPYGRQTSLMVFDLSVMRCSDLGAQVSRSSSGYCTEEACRITRYLGSSSSLQAAVFSGHDPYAIERNASTNTMAQLIWYFISGFNQRIDETPDSSEKFTRYTLQISQCDFDLTFVRSNRSGRWWVNLPGSPDAYHPCAHTDYRAACEDRVTDRILQYIDLSLQAR